MTIMEGIYDHNIGTLSTYRLDAGSHWPSQKSNMSLKVRVSRTLAGRFKVFGFRVERGSCDMSKVHC